LNAILYYVLCTVNNVVLCQVKIIYTKLLQPRALQTLYRAASVVQRHIKIVVVRCGCSSFMLRRVALCIDFIQNGRRRAHIAMQRALHIPWRTPSPPRYYTFLFSRRRMYLRMHSVYPAAQMRSGADLGREKKSTPAMHHGDGTQREGGALNQWGELIHTHTQHTH
jgi:hypothetical protein